MYNRRINKFSAGFETTIPGNGRPQVLAVRRTVILLRICGMVLVGERGYWKGKGVTGRGKGLLEGGRGYGRGEGVSGGWGG
jgi:hypothetical protein